MIAYLDTTVVLRAVFGEPDAFAGWAGVDSAVSSQLLRNEALRTLDRRRVSAALPETLLARVHATTHDLLSRVSLGTLDALHLATDLLSPGAPAPAACRPPSAPPTDLTPDTP